VKPDHRLDRFALREIIAERSQRAGSGFEQMLGFEPPREQGARRGRGAEIACGSPVEDLAAHVRYERREKLFVGGGAQGFVGGKPALFRDERGVRRAPSRFRNFQGFVEDSSRSYVK